jgi:hypothetical protein
MGCTSCRVRPDSTATAPAETARLPLAAPTLRLFCPTLGSTRATLPPAAQAGHRVVLTWKAGLADTKHDPAVGYCIYRGTKPHDPAPQLISPMAFPGTSCTDDWVLNGQKYYYVVRAISAKGAHSVVSREAPAAIPSGAPSNPSSSVAPVALCRDPAVKK